MNSSGPARGFFASRRAIAVAALVCIALLLISANIVIGRWFTARLDLTADKLYTLSPGTLHTLAKIDEPITLRLYYSKQLGDEVPAYGVYAQRVRELLDQYVAAAADKIRLETYSPQPFSDVEDRAVAFGLQAVPLDAEGDHVYFGLAATNSTDDQQVIPFFSPDRERFLEYDLTKLVHSLAVPKKTVVGLISTLPLQGDMMAVMQGQPSRPMAVMDQLQQLDKVERLGADINAIPADVDVLMLVHPQNLPPKTLFAIDQFVLRGGKALIFVDPHSELQAAQPSQASAPGTPTSSNFVPLFKSWGFEMLPNIVAGDRSDAQQVSVPVPGRGEEPLDYIAWLDLKAANLNRDDMITADLSHITMASAGILEPLPGAKTNFEPLITTSPDSTKIPADKLNGLPDVAGLLADFKPDGKRYVLAAHVTGPVKTAFPNGPPQPVAAPGAPKPAEKSPPAGNWLKQSEHPINVVVAADTMLDDRVWVQSQDFFGQRVVVPIANNGDFVADAVDVLAGGEDLVGLRSRGTAARPFTVVDRLQREAQTRYSAEEHALRQKLKATEAKLADLTGKDQTDTQKRSLILLMAATFIAVVLAAAALATGGTGSGPGASDMRALPALSARLGDVATVEVRRTGLDLTFVRDGDNWFVAQKSNYPADSGKIRRVVLALADMTLVEPKTGKPGLYPRLEVEDAGKGKSTLVTIKDKSGADIARLILGKRSFDRLGEGNDGVYVRKPGDPQSWLARGSLDFSDDMPNRLVRRIIDIPDSKIAKVALTQPDGTTLTLSRATPDAKFALENPPKDAKYKSDTVLGEPAMALETLDFDDVEPAAKLPVPDKGLTIGSYTTFGGLTVTVKLFQHGNKNWLAVVTTGAGKAADEAKKIDGKVSRWVYAIPSYKAKMIETKLADLLEPPKGS